MPYRYVVKAPAHGTMFYVRLEDDDLDLVEDAKDATLYRTKEEAEKVAFEFIVWNPEDLGRVEVAKIPVIELAPRR